MAILSSLLACLGCSDGTSARGPPTAPGHASPSSTNNLRTTAPGSAAPASGGGSGRRSHQSVRPSMDAQTAALKAHQHAQAQGQSQGTVHSQAQSQGTQTSQTSASNSSLPGTPTRRSSRAKLELPLQYVQDPQEEDPEGSMILGRKASYSMGMDSQPSTRAASRANSNTNLMALADEDHSLHSTDDDEVRLLGPIKKPLRGRKCLVLDLDETLVHSSFKYVPDADFIIPVEIENRFHNVYVSKRPGVDEFLHKVGDLFEVVVFTASVAKYGDPLLDHLDMQGVVHHRLFRESCYNLNGNYIKNLSQLGRPLRDVIIIDNSPASYALQPQNAIPVSSWFSDPHDNELLAMIPFLTDLAARTVPDVSVVLDVYIN